MPACAPVSEMAGTPMAWSAIATSVPLMCSPVASSRSISRGSGSSVMRAASSSRWSVVSPMALDHDHEVGAGRPLARDAARDMADAVGVREGRAAVLLDDQLGHGPIIPKRSRRVIRRSIGLT